MLFFFKTNILITVSKDLILRYCLDFNGGGGCENFQCGWRSQIRQNHNGGDSDRGAEKRGFTVGTVKTINCPMFSMEEKESSNTFRHKKAGADVVCASAKGETAFIYARGMDRSRIFEKMGTDYLILEGDYQADVPRIVCAHNEREVMERKNEFTFLVSGRIADSCSRVCGVEAVSAYKDR